METLLESLLRHERTAPDRVALLAPRRASLTRTDLLSVVRRVHEALAHAGVTYQDRVAVVMPPGPEAAVACVAVATGAVCVPLNPQLADADWPQCIEFLGIDALLTAPGTSPAAEAAAREADVRLLAVHPDPKSAAGVFTVRGVSVANTSRAAAPGLDSIAFVLPTSGTTAYPKAVPLTHRNLSHSVGNVARMLRLSEEDRLLSVLPLHHAHGLISGLLSAVAAGSSVICFGEFAADAFFASLLEQRPTWYTAVPAIHQAVLDEATRTAVDLRGHSLRLIRSASAPLAQGRLEALERLFGVPVLETYGMTEATSQIASNPLPPARRKANSVGIAAGPEIAILTEDGRELEPGRSGEIALRGPTIATGPLRGEAQSGDWTDSGWFRTGDLGELDADGYLYVHGRIQDVINRGGEKLLPGKIEAVLLEHESVLEAVVYGCPHPRLGEDVAAVVRQTAPATLSARDLQTFARGSGRLRELEIPHHIRFVDQIPRSTSGKVARHELSASFEEQAATAHAPSAAACVLPPRTDLEKRIAVIWSRAFGLDHVPVNADFFALGGDSLLATQIASELEDGFGVVLDLQTLFAAPTISELAGRVLEGTAALEAFELLPASTTQAVGEVSIAQQGVLERQRALRGFPIFNVSLAYRLRGDLVPEHLERAWRRLVVRHELLRTTYTILGNRWRTRPSAAVNVGLPVEDWRIVEATHREDFAKGIAADEMWSDFDLARMPPFRLRLLRFATDDHALTITLHHVMMDAWTVKMLVEELFEQYRAVVQGHPDPPSRARLQYADFARWQRHWCEGPEARRQWDYWRSQLERAVSPLGERAGRAGASSGFATDRAPVHLTSELMHRVEGFARDENCTPFIVLLTVLKALLMLRSGLEDISIATPMANRSRPRTEHLPGLIENACVVRTALKPSLPIHEALRVVFVTVLEAHAHQELPFEVLARRLEAGGTTTSPLTDVYFSVVSQMDPQISDAGLQVSRIENFLQAGQLVLPASASRLLWLLKETDSGLIGSCLYRPGVLDAEQANALVLQFQKMVERAVLDRDVPLAQLAAPY